MTAADTRRAAKRYVVIDLARALALLGMISFHIAYDLEMFGWLRPGTASTGWFWYHARLTAGSFIFLAGLGLWLSHGKGIRWAAFWRRFVKIALAAALVSLATYFAMPDVMIFYGILHSIAVSSLLGLAFLRLPWLVNLAIAAGVFALPYYYSDPSFGGIWVWSGLSGQAPLTADFEPIFPWFAPFLAGLALGQILSRFALWQRLEMVPGAFARALAWFGSRSLPIYLIHQPVLIAVIAGLSYLLRS